MSDLLNPDEIVLLDTNASECVKDAYSLDDQWALVTKTSVHNFSEVFLSVVQT